MALLLCISYLAPLHSNAVTFSLLQTEMTAAMAFWLREEGVDGFLVSGAELFVEDAGNSYQAASAEFVSALRTAFDEVATETGKDRALIVRLGGDGNATQRSVYYGTADVAGANLVINDRVVDGISKLRSWPLSPVFSSL